ncbi:hypothetical protein [Streptomyces cyaneofuscatus]|uniref:hypothetical protein n=1 Tax=Streptomyces cyaneofuscatus TaxID=66883 RepID=UPI00365AE17D
MNAIAIRPNATGKRLLITAPYHAPFQADLKDIGGRWSEVQGTWQWSTDARDEERVRALLRSHFGTDGSPQDMAVRVSVHVPLHTYELPFTQGGRAQFAGRTIAWRPTRNAPVKLGSDVILVAGKLPASGGSTKYPQIAAGPDVVVEVRDLPRVMLGMHDSGEYVIVREETEDAGEADTDQLRARREELLAQVRELDDVLGERDPEGETRRRQQADEDTARSVTVRLEREHVRDKAAAIRELVLEQQRQEQERAAAERAERCQPLSCRCGKHTCPPVGDTPAQYAEAKGVSAATATQWCRSGRIPAARHNGRWYVVDH